VYWLKYWAVFAIALLAEQFPLIGHVLGLVPIWPEIRLLFAVWCVFLFLLCVLQGVNRYALLLRVHTLQVATSIYSRG